VQGATGYPGPNGLPGFTGFPGAPGFQGATGFTGLSGNAGECLQQFCSNNNRTSILQPRMLAQLPN